MASVHCFWRFVSSLTSLLSGELLLTKCRIPNSGAVVFARSVFIGVVLYLIVLAIKNMVDPATSSAFDIQRFRQEVASTIAWFGAIFAGAYATLYSRFASQWTYLANLYNKIKETELRIPAGRSKSHKKTLAAWKAGFIEDADDLHLARKHMFAFTVKTWGSELEVAEIFSDYTPGGRKRFDRIMREVTLAVQREESEYA